MQRLGRALHVSPSRNIIARIENPPRIGDVIVDESLRQVGRVSDIFGPVSSPYASVKPMIQEPEKLTSKMLYVFPSKKRKEKEKHDW